MLEFTLPTSYPSLEALNYTARKIRETRDTSHHMQEHVRAPPPLLMSIEHPPRIPEKFVARRRSEVNKPSSCIKISFSFIFVGSDSPTSQRGNKLSPRFRGRLRSFAVFASSRVLEIEIYKITNTIAITHSAQSREMLGTEFMIHRSAW